MYFSSLQILVHVGFLTEESGDVFSPKVLKGGPLGEMVQWADILTALHVLGHNLKISMSVKELQGNEKRNISIIPDSRVTALTELGNCMSRSNSCSLVPSCLTFS
ncbi:hypothetical protein ILYODFUR_014053 [Ilyodon furcidens]|uniref:alpha-1,6-mannosyl-glycoprotein 6-beta-N-acetylglucosaminyltransferase n=1 Tax=Ilyodon furcidens TaxID=33524 RepID=A0ABV0UGW8_9TELE